MVKRIKFPELDKELRKSIISYSYKVTKSVSEGLREIVRNEVLMLRNKLKRLPDSKYRHGILHQPHFADTIKFWSRWEGGRYKVTVYSVHPRAPAIIGMFETGSRKGYVQYEGQPPVFIETETSTRTFPYPVVTGKYGDTGIYVRRIGQAKVKPIIRDFYNNLEAKIKAYMSRFKGGGK